MLVEQKEFDVEEKLTNLQKNRMRLSTSGGT